MSIDLRMIEEVRRLGTEYGEELAAALVLASKRDTDRALQRQMASIVLRQIETAVDKLRDASFPAELADEYEQAARAGVRNELIKDRDVAAGLQRHAA